MSALIKEASINQETDNASDEGYTLFKTNAEAIGAKVYKCSDPQSARQEICQIAHSVNAKEIVVAESFLESQLSLKTLTDKGLTFHYDNILENGKRADIGISEADFAVAETGTLCQDSLDVNKRLVSSLPLVHIVIIKESNIMEKFSDSLGLVKGSGSAHHGGYYTFISGPSRTSDIERVLTIGVHGPEELHIIFISDIK